MFGREIKERLCCLAIGGVCALLLTLLDLIPYPTPASAQSVTIPSSAIQTVVEDAMPSSPDWVAKPATFSFRVDAPEWDGRMIPVLVTGVSPFGENVSESIAVTPGETVTLDYVPGDYSFEISGESLSDSETVYRTTQAKTTFDGRSSVAIALAVEKDDEATEELARERARQEEEARRAREAEEARAREEATYEASVGAIDPNEKTVYITLTGSKYHNGGCRYLKKSKIEISLEDAEAQGYTPCKVCF